jgi:hypothetical protein
MFGLANVARCRHAACRGSIHLNAGDLGRRLPPSTDPRFIGPPGDDNSFLYYVARAGITDGDGQQALIEVAHEICSDLAHRTTYMQEEANLAAQAPGLVSSAPWIWISATGWPPGVPVSARLSARHG